jgi:hypothetical protein
LKSIEEDIVALSLASSNVNKRNATVLVVEVNDIYFEEINPGDEMKKIIHP